MEQRQSAQDCGKEKVNNEEINTNLQKIEMYNNMIKEEQYDAILGVRPEDIASIKAFTDEDEIQYLIDLLEIKYVEVE